VHVTLVTAAFSGTHTRAMGWQAARPCADTGAPDNGMCRYRRGAAEIPAGVSVTGSVWVSFPSFVMSSQFVRIEVPWAPVAVPLTLPFSSVAMRLGPVPAGPVYSCVGAAGRFAAVCCVRGGVFRGIKSSSSTAAEAVNDMQSMSHAVRVNPTLH